MPLYEYESIEDGQTLTLLRLMRDADEPVEDPHGRGRTFVRKHSTFSTPAPGIDGKPSASLPMRSGGGCACGNPHGPCNG